MTQSENPSKALIQMCLRYTALRMHSKQELIKYLSTKSVDEEICNQVIAYFEANNLIDDQEFARLWAESRLKRGKGDLIIQSELYQKGIAKEIVSTTIARISPQVWHDAITVAVGKYQSKLEPLSGFERKARVFQLLRMRGFSGRHIDAFVRSRVE